MQTFRSTTEEKAWKSLCQDGWPLGHSVVLREMSWKCRRKEVKRCTFQGVIQWRLGKDDTSLTFRMKYCKFIVVVALLLYVEARKFYLIWSRTTIFFSFFRD